MTIVAATRRDRGRNFLQPGVVLKCPFGTSWKQRFVEGGMCSVRADLGGHLKYSRRWSGVRAGVLLGAQGAVRRGENRGGL